MVRRLLPLVVSLALGGCAAFFLRDIHDLSFSDLQIVDLDTTPELEPEKWSVPRPYHLLRIGLVTQRDLDAFSRHTGSSVVLQASFCNGTEIDNGRRVGDPYVYEVGGQQVGPYGPQRKALAAPQDRAPTPGPHGYRVFIPLEKPAKAFDVFGPDRTYPAYDLRRQPADICLRLGGGTMASTFTSNILRIPAIALRAALDQAGP